MKPKQSPARTHILTCSARGCSSELLPFGEVSYILKGEEKKKEKPTGINVTLLLLPGRMAIGTNLKEEIMRGMEIGRFCMYTNADFSVASCLLQ